MQIPFFIAIEARTTKERKRYWHLAENIIFNSPNRCLSSCWTQHYTLSINKLQFNPIQCLTNEADQDCSSVTSWLRHAERCNIHSHQRTEEWKQSPTETQYIRRYHHCSIPQERVSFYMCVHVANSRPGELIWCWRQCFRALSSELFHVIFIYKALWTKFVR